MIVIQVELGFGLPPPVVGDAGFKFGFGGLTNFGLLPDDEPDEHPVVQTGAANKANTSKNRIARRPR